MSEFDENRLTDLMEHVGRALIGEGKHVPMEFGCEEPDCSPEKFPSHYEPGWDQTSMDQRRIMKQNVLPVALAIFEFVETNPNEKVLAIKQALEYTFLEYNGLLPEQEQDVLEAWNTAFPEHPLDLTNTGEDEEEE